MALEILRLNPPSACEGETVLATLNQDIERPIVLIDNFPAHEVAQVSGREVSFKVPRTPLIPSDDPRDEKKERDLGGIAGVYDLVIIDTKNGEAWAQLEVLGSDIVYIDKKDQEEVGQQVYVMLTAPGVNQVELTNAVESVTGKDTITSLEFKLLTHQDSKNPREDWLGDGQLVLVGIKGEREAIGKTLHGLRSGFGLVSAKTDRIQGEDDGYEMALAHKRQGLPVWSICPDVIRRCAVHGGSHVGPLDDPEYFCPGWLGQFEEFAPKPAFSKVEVNDVIVAVLDSATNSSEDDFIFDADPNDPFIQDSQYPANCGGELPPNPLVRGHGLPIGNAIKTIANVVNITYRNIVYKRTNNLGKEEYVVQDSQVIPAIYDVLREARQHFGLDSRLNVVFNMSFCSFEGCSILRYVLRDAARQGALFAAAAGNWEAMRRDKLKLFKGRFEKKHKGVSPGKLRQQFDHFERKVNQARVYPAAYDIPEVIGVGALQKRKGPHGKWERAPWSMRGDWVNVCAIGCQLKLKGPDGKDHLYQGTSFATPIVAAALALLRSYNPHLRTDEIAKCLIDQARNNRVNLPLPPLAIGQMSDEEFGAGPVIPDEMTFKCS